MNKEELIAVLQSYAALTIFDAEENEYVSMTREFGEAVMGYGETSAESLTMLQENLSDMVELYMSKGLSLPTPMPMLAHTEYSGRFTVRVPKTTHRDLACIAMLESVSASQLAAKFIERGIESYQSDSWTNLMNSVPDKEAPSAPSFPSGNVIQIFNAG